MSPIPISIRPHRHAPSRQQKPDGVFRQERSAPILHDAPIAAAMDLELFIPRLEVFFRCVPELFRAAIPPIRSGQAVARVGQLAGLQPRLHAITRVLEVVFRRVNAGGDPQENRHKIAESQDSQDDQGP